MQIDPMFASLPPTQGKLMTFLKELGEFVDGPLQPLYQKTVTLFIEQHQPLAPLLEPMAEIRALGELAGYLASVDQSPLRTLETALAQNRWPALTQLHFAQRRRDTGYYRPSFAELELWKVAQEYYDRLEAICREDAAPTHH